MRLRVASIRAGEPPPTEHAPRAEARLALGHPPQARPPAAFEAGRVVAFYALLVLFGLVSLLWSAVAAVLHRLLPQRLGEPVGQRVMTAGFRAFLAAARRSGLVRLDLGELDALDGAEPLVIVPNHPSLLDAVLVMSRVPRAMCAAKASLWNNRFLGGAVRLAGFARNDSPTRLIREAVRSTRSGRHFLIFPEGTRSSAWPVGPFKGGFALIAKHAGAPVQTVFIETNSHFLGKGWPLFKRPDFPLSYRVRLGRRIAVTGDAHELVDRLRRYYQEELGGGGPRR